MQLFLLSNEKNNQQLIELPSQVKCSIPITQRASKAVQAKLRVRLLGDVVQLLQFFGF
jgi:hypothetical protein